MAYLHDASTGFASLESDGGQTAAFASSDVEAGLMWFRGPGGGSRLQVAWLLCP